MEGAQPQQNYAPSQDQGYGQYDQMQDTQFQQEQPCAQFNKWFMECLQQNNQDISMCQSNMDNLIQCQQQQANVYN